MTTRTVKDQLSDSIAFSFPPQRILSLVPSQTELLHTLETGNRVCGITKFCIHPKEWIAWKTVVGGTKHFDFDAIDRLQPDLIIGNKEENYEEGIVRLKMKYPVWMSDVVNLDDAIQMIRSVGDITACLPKAEQLTEQISSSFKTLSKATGERVLYLIWRKPWMAAGKGTFIDDMLTRNGYANAIDQLRYPVLTAKEITNLSPDYIFLSSEPYPFSEKHARELKSIAVNPKIFLVDGEMFSWYGSRLRYSCDYFRTLPGK